MGTWGTGPFDNDAAAEWRDALGDVTAAQRVELIRRALAGAAEQDSAKYLDHDIADEAVAAATVVALLLSEQPLAGCPTAPELLGDEELTVLPRDLSRLALQALDRVDGDNSELRSLWGNDYEQVLEERRPIRATLERAAATS